MFAAATQARREYQFKQSVKIFDVDKRRTDTDRLAEILSLPATHEQRGAGSRDIEPNTLADDLYDDDSRKRYETPYPPNILYRI